MNEEEKELLTVDYQKRFSHFLHQLNECLAELITQEDNIGLIFLIECMSSIVQKAYQIITEKMKPSEDSNWN